MERTRQPYGCRSVAKQVGRRPAEVGDTNKGVGCGLRGEAGREMVFVRSGDTGSRDTPLPPGGPPSFQEIAHVAGWLHASVFGDWFPPHGISAFYPVTRFDAQDVAENAAVAIQSRVAELAAATFHKVRRNDDDRLFASVNPRFVVVAETELSLGELAKAREQLQRVEDAASGNVALEEGFVRFYLPKIRPTLDQIKALNTPFESKKQRFPKNEANIVVRDWLTEHGKDERVSIRDVEEGTCVPISSISGLSSWQSYQDEWGQKRKPELRTVPLSEPILAARRDGREDDPSVIAERKEDEDTWEQVLNSAESSTKRKQLVEMPADKRQELIELYRQQKRDEAAKP